MPVSWSSLGNGPHSRSVAPPVLAGARVASTTISNSTGIAARRGPAILALILGAVFSVIMAAVLREAESHEMQAGIRQIARDRVEVLRGQVLRSMEVLFT